eukprot:1231491-Pyramimonas_sp.AAC.1
MAALASASLHRRGRLHWLAFWGHPERIASLCAVLFAFNASLISLTSDLQVSGGSAAVPVLS